MRIRMAVRYIKRELFAKKLLLLLITIIHTEIQL